MKVGTSYKRATLAETWDVIVIGSGIGGLTAAMLLSVHGGKRVLVLERHYEAGGFTHTFRRPGYEWDVGLHYVGQVQDERLEVRRAFDHVTGGKLQWHALPDVYDRILIEGETFDLVAGVERFRDSLKQRFPREGLAIDRYIAAVQSCIRAIRLYYVEKAIPGPLAAVAGGLMRAPFLRWSGRTTREVIKSLSASPELMGVLTAQWGDIGLPPSRSSFGMHATIVDHYLGGASYPVGGAAAIAAAIAPQIERGGGGLVTSAEVSGILLKGAKAVGVRMSDGREFRAPMVVSNAGAATTFDRLLPADLPTLDSLRGQLRTLEPSTAHLCLYVGLKQSDAALGLEASNLWIYPSYDHDANVERSARDIDAPFPGAYISFPSGKDPTFQDRFPGKGTIEVITVIPYETFARWGEKRLRHRGEDYDALKQRLSDRLRAELEQHVPSTVGNIAYTELSTPVTTRHFTNYSHGEIYGISATPERYATRALGARTPIHGLYLTGQDVVNLGVVGALYGGIICASAALGKNLLSKMSKLGKSRLV